MEFTRVPTLPFIVSAMEGEIGRAGVQRCFDAVGVHREVACAPSSVLPMRDLFGLFEWFARARGDQDFGIFIGKAFNPDAFGLFVRYAMQAPTLGDAIGRVSRGVRFHQTCSAMALEVSEETAAWTYSVTLPLTFGRAHHGIHVLMQMITLVNGYLGFAPPLVEVGLEADRPRGADATEDKLGAPVRWRQPTNYVRFPASLLAASRDMGLAAIPTTWSDLIRYARTTPPRTVAEKTEAALRQCLADGRASADAVAEYLNIGIRTMQRQLAVEGVAFSGLLEHVRRGRAYELLTESDVPMWRIAEILCYSDPAHFTRAYRRWNGTTPNELRRRVGSIT